MYYNTTTKEICFTTKTFVISHPIKEKKHLVHVCLEGPEAGVYYRGEGETSETNVNSFEGNVSLPEYVNKISKEQISVQLTPIYEEKSDESIPDLAYTLSKEGFRVHSTKKSKFYWMIMTKMESIKTIISKTTKIHGIGPYRYIV